MPTTLELQTLLEFPAEKLTVEYKSWLNLEENPGRATPAKAGIALANEGGDQRKLIRGRFDARSPLLSLPQQRAPH